MMLLMAQHGGGFQPRQTLTSAQRLSRERPQRRLV